MSGWGVRDSMHRLSHALSESSCGVTRPMANDCDCRPILMTSPFSRHSFSPSLSLTLASRSHHVPPCHAHISLRLPNGEVFASEPYAKDASSAVLNSGVLFAYNRKKISCQVFGCRSVLLLLLKKESSHLCVNFVRLFGCVITAFDALLLQYHRATYA